MIRATGAHHPPGYELRVAGHLDPRWSVWFGRLTLTLEDDGTTALRGPVADQAELHGLLAKVRDLGATLLSLTPLDPAGTADPARRGTIRRTAEGGSSMSDTTEWLPAGWVHPTRCDLPTGHHLRPIREDDVALDHPAVMESRERLWSIYGEAWGWPPTMTVEQDQADLARHEREIEAHLSFNYALFDAAETALLGCVYIDPAERVGADAEISWWVIDPLIGSPVEAALDAFVPGWIARDWPLRRPRYVGRDLTWAQWLTLPEIPPVPD